MWGRADKSQVRSQVLVVLRIVVMRFESAAVLLDPLVCENENVSFSVC